MATSLRPCPACSRPMDSARTVCVFCQQAGQQPTIQMPAQAPPPRPKAPAQNSPNSTFIVAFLIPIVGVVFGLLKAFDPQPDQKRLAGYGFAGALAGFVAWFAAVTYLFPLMVGGLGAPVYNQGVEAFQTGNYRLAETHFQAAASTDPGWAAAWVNLSAAQLLQQNAAGCEASARRAIVLFDGGKPGAMPDGYTAPQLEALAHGNLAGAHAMQLNLPAAAIEAKRALEIDPGNPKAPNWQSIVQLSGQ